jgi:hypothetical protein
MAVGQRGCLTRHSIGNRIEPPHQKGRVSALVPRVVPRCHGMDPGYFFLAPLESESGMTRVSFCVGWPYPRRFLVYLFRCTVYERQDEVRGKGSLA